MPLIYEELRTLAASFMRRERSDHTLQPTALVHEAYIRLLGQHSTDFAGRSHFFAIAAQMIRRVLLDHARAGKAEKRGGEQIRVEFTTNLAAGNGRSQEELILLNEALDRLAERSPRQARLVELRYFGGLSLAEAAAALEVSPATVKRDWLVAKAWLAKELVVS